MAYDSNRLDWSVLRFWTKTSNVGKLQVQIADKVILACTSLCPTSGLYLVCVCVKRKKNHIIIPGDNVMYRKSE